MPSDSNATRSDVLILFGETNQQVKSGLRHALRQQGYVKIKDVLNESDLRAGFFGELPDIAIIDYSLSGDIVGAVRELRQGRVGINPYVPMILTSWTAEADIIRKLLNSGADEILLKPLAPNALFERINSLVTRRKPYLTAGDYVGPDRRGGRADPNAPDVNLIHPPNTLKAKIEGHPLSREELLGQIQAAQVGMAEQRISRDVARIANLSKAIQEALEQGRRDQKLFSELDQLVFLGRDLKAQLADTQFAQVLPILDSLQKAATELRDGLPNLEAKKVHLLPPLSEAISAVIGSPEARRHIAEIVQMMKQAKPAR